MYALSSLLVQDHVVSVDTIEKALQRQVMYGGELDTNLLELGAVDEATLVFYKSQVSGLRFAQPEDFEHVQEDAVRSVSAELAEKHGFFPLSLKGGRLRVALYRSPEESSLSEAEQQLRLKLEPLVTSELRVRVALHQHYGVELPRRLRGLTGFLSGVSELYSAHSAAAAEQAAPPAPSTKDDAPASLEAIAPPPPPDAGPAPEPGPAQQSPPPHDEQSVLPLAKGLELLERATSREEVFDIALRVSGGVLEYLVLFVVKGQVALAKAARGEGATAAELATRPVPIEENGVLWNAVQSMNQYLGPLQPLRANDALLRALGRPRPASVLLLPITVKQRLAVLLYADNGARPLSGYEFAALLPLARAMTAAFERLILWQKRQPPAPSLSPPATEKKRGASDQAPSASRKQATIPAAARGAERGSQQVPVAKESTSSVDQRPQTAPPARVSSVAPREKRGTVSLEAALVKEGVLVLLNEVLSDASQPDSVAMSEEATERAIISQPVTTETSALVGEQEVVVGEAAPASESAPAKGATAEEYQETLEEGTNSEDQTRDVADDIAPTPETERAEAHGVQVWTAEPGTDQAPGQETESPETDESPTSEEEDSATDVSRPSRRMAALRFRRRQIPAFSLEGNLPAVFLGETLIPQGTPGSSAEESGREAWDPAVLDGPDLPDAALDVAVENTQELPSVIVDMGADIESIVQRALGDGQVAEVAADELVSLGEPGIPPLIQRFPGAVNIDWNHLEQLPEPSKLGRLLELLQRYGKTAVPYLAPQLLSSDRVCRFCATLLLGRIDDSEALAALGHRLLDSDPQVVWLARAFLSDAAKKGKVPVAVYRAVRVELRDDSIASADVVRACQAVAVLRDREAVPSLFRLLRASDPTIRSGAVQALRLLTGHDFGESPRRWAAWWGRAAGQHRIEWLIAGLDHRSIHVRSVASRELRELIGVDLSFDPEATRRERERVRRKYLDWWRAEGQQKFVSRD